MDILGTRWRIVEYRFNPYSSSLHTYWTVEHKFAGLFWCRCCGVTHCTPVGDIDFDFDSLNEAKKALLRKLGPDKFNKIVSCGKLDVKSLPPLTFGHRIIDSTRFGDPCKNYELVYGHYEKMKDCEIFIVNEHVISDNDASPLEIMIKARLRGIVVDNGRDFDEKYNLGTAHSPILVI